jgi:hypothetical protein
MIVCFAQLVRDDDRVTSFSVSTALSITNEHDGKWVVRQVSNRVDFVLDGISLSSLVEATEIGGLEYQVTPFELTTIDARSILAGEAPFEESISDTSRTPLLVCPCGDLLCGALTVKLSRDTKGVAWSEWAWENYLEPAQPVPSLPVCPFEPTTYEETLRAAELLALANREPVTRVRVRQPGPWWRNILRIPQERTDPGAMLGWLHAEAVIPALGEADDDYADFLINLDSAQTLLAGAASRNGELDSRQRAEVIDALMAVDQSPHRISLPPETLDAVRWHLERLKR